VLLSSASRLTLAIGLAACLCTAGALRVGAAEVADATRLLWAGEYEKCLDACQKGIADDQSDENWWLLKIRAQMVCGQYRRALGSYRDGIARAPQSIRIQLLGYDVLRMNDQTQQAQQLLADVVQNSTRNAWRYTSPANRVALGQVLLLCGADARQVLEQFFDRAKQDSPDSIEPYLASGQLALDKNDLALAAESFEQAAKRSPEDPDIHLGLARAYETDSKRATAELNKALELNPRHVDSLLYQADNLIDQEAYDDAAKLLKQVLEINPKNPLALSYQAVLAHLSGDRATEQTQRAEALSTWHTNPQVDHLIGLKLSQKYRFAEGQTYQRRSLQFDPNYAPAKIQLCQDLLRLGQEDEGWRLADEVFRDDPYNVLAFNLNTLHDNLAKFRAIQNPQFLVRMDPREEQIYGRRVLDLLMRARERLCAKYGVELPASTTVEIFPTQKDFAIRTFGIPGGAGYLGVCFGPVITANSPASRAGHPVNWQSVLWHEFCHTVTLTKTHNKMPRWLSEGISVYEERQQNPAWGQSMNPQYREMILNPDHDEQGITPVSKLSSAFLKSSGAMQLQFAYYESSMVVQYVVDHYGIQSLKQILDDLAQDVPINDALARHTQTIDKLDKSFDKWLHEQAEQLAPGVDWERPKLALDADSASLAAWNKEHPNSFYGLLAEGQALLAEQKFEQAKAPLESAAKLYPGYAEVGGPYVLLAAVYRGLGQPASERAMLEKHISLNANAVEPRLRLLEILSDQKDWSAVKKIATQVLAINPLIPAPHRYLADAAEALGDRELAIDSQRILLSMDPFDAAEHHYRLARLLSSDQSQLQTAKHEVILALEDAPRFREAHRLLLDIVSRIHPATAPASQP
jgi:tetratricopeptide (TPR) repeat protein